jgi:hypothetical protein
MAGEKPVKFKERKQNRLDNIDSSKVREKAWLYR